MANFLLFLFFCLSHCPISLSGCLKGLIYQEVLVEVLSRDHDKMELAMLYFRTYLLWNLCRSIGDVETAVWAKFEIVHDFVIG